MPSSVLKPFVLTPALLLALGTGTASAADTDKNVILRNPSAIQKSFQIQAKPAQVVPIVAITRAQSRLQGKLTIGRNIPWQCQKNRCENRTLKGRLAVADCRALVAKVGPVVSYRYGKRYLKKEYLDQCNRVLAGIRYVPGVSRKLIARPGVPSLTQPAPSSSGGTSTAGTPSRSSEPTPRDEAGALTGLTAAHNAERRLVGSPALRWSPTVAGAAQQWAEHLATANNCQLAHNPAGVYGANLFWSTSPANAERVVGQWAAEKANYNAAANTCAAGQVCGHYTQVVWSATTELGCGMATCSNRNQIWVCNYNPRGNYAGQRPFGSAPVAGPAPSSGSVGAPAPAGDGGGALAGITAAHNAERGLVGSPDLRWSPAVADMAQRWAEHLATVNSCRLAHNPDSPYGENLFWTTTPVSADRVVGQWAAEKANYNAATNTCAAGQVCGHYTQVVWSATTELGCGMATCSNRSQIWVCNYNPRGNYVGQLPF